jgi:glutaredoxin
MATLPQMFAGCAKHDSEFQYATPPPPCVHCAEDEKILEERIIAVAHAIVPMYSFTREREAIAEALRSLVSEIRR